VFTYSDDYFANRDKPAISLSFPKMQKQYEANELFPFFYGMLAEGINKDIQCRLLKIDEDDDFTRLIKTAGEDTIGAITVKELTEEV
jgi:serine/threonine-protein kinase HipA